MSGVQPQSGQRVSDYDQEIAQSHIVDQPTAFGGRATEHKQSQDIQSDLVAQSVARLIADPGVVSSITAWSHTFVEIDHEIISTVILLPSADSRRAGNSYKRNYVHEVLVKGLVKLFQEKIWLG